MAPQSSRKSASTQVGAALAELHGMLTTRAVGTVLALLMSRNAWAQTAPETEAPPMTPVDLESAGTTAGLKFHVTATTTAGAQTPLGGRTGACVAPCDAQLPPVAYRIALSVPGSSPVVADQPITISGPVTVRGEYVSYKWMRSTGWVVLVGGTIAGFAVAATSFNDNHSSEHYSDPGGQGLAIAAKALLAAPILLASVGIGLPMILKSDEVKITVSPLTTASAPLRRSDAPSIASGLVPRGVGLFGAF
jgi:hypothetical protein